MSRAWISKSEAKKVRGHIEVLKPLLHVADWRIIVLEEWADDDCWASVWMLDEKKQAHVRLGKAWPGLSAEDKQNCLVHELIHLLHREQLEPFYTLGDEKVLPASTFRVARSQIRQQTEVMVDTLANIIAPHMPAYPS